MLQTLKLSARRAAVFAMVAVCASLLTACQAPFTDNALIVPDLLTNPERFNGTDVTVNGAYLNRLNDPAAHLLALGVSTQDNGLGVEPLGDPIWLEGFPADQLREQLHQPGDATYGFVHVTGRFESGAAYGPNNAFKHRLMVSAAEPFERIQRSEQRIGGATGEGITAITALAADPASRNGQTVTTQGYYFWNGAVNVLAEGVSAEQDGANPQPIGAVIWMEGFPPPVSGELNVGPGSPPAYVWGKVEVVGQFQGGGSYGKDGAYTTFLQLDPNSADAAKAIK
ncbi:MAG: hypothetical protein H7Z42_17225 [Roseiflexaceae bacterium]|nr:hypothetical protein [Roseiflexaceae bacterium]